MAAADFTYHQFENPFRLPECAGGYKLPFPEISLCGKGSTPGNDNIIFLFMILFIICHKRIVVCNVITFLEPARGEGRCAEGHCVKRLPCTNPIPAEPFFNQ